MYGYFPSYLHCHVADKQRWYSISLISDFSDQYHAGCSLNDCPASDGGGQQLIVLTVTQLFVVYFFFFFINLQYNFYFFRSGITPYLTTFQVSSVTEQRNVTWKSHDQPRENETKETWLISGCSREEAPGASASAGGQSSGSWCNRWVKVSNVDHWFNNFCHDCKDSKSWRTSGSAARQQGRDGGQSHI